MGRDARSFGAQLKALREAAGFTQEELATISGVSVHAVSALERGERRRPHLETVRALSAALDLTPPIRDALVASARPTAHDAAADELTASSLPLPLTTLLGRDREVALLQQWLAEPVVRLITLTGPGGVGKTRVALEVARALTKEAPVRVTFVSLAAVRDVAFVASAIAVALGLADVAERDLPARVRAAYQDSPTVLVLDNFEHVLAAAPLVADLLTSVASLRVLVTSRAPLHIRGEREYAVGPLALDAGADAMPPADLARVAAVRLFLERVREVQRDFQLTPANGPTITAICRRLDALPLALELAAPWTKTLTAEGLLRGLEQNELMSTGGPRDLPERQQTMNATVAWSYQLLDPHEQRAFRRLGALSGRFPIEAAAAVLSRREASSTKSDNVLGAVAGLIDKSLLMRTETSVPSRPLYQMLETVRAYAALELAAAGEHDDALEALARYCSREASAAAEGLVGLAQAEWLNRIHDELENYRVALTWLIARGRAPEASGIAWPLLWFWAIRGHATEGLRWYERILNLSSLPPTVESRALLGAAAMLYSQGELGRARTALTRTLTLARSSGDMDVVVLAEWLFGHVELAVGKLDAARDLLSRSVQGFKKVAIPWGTGAALIGMARVVLATGDVDEAEHLLDDATSMVRQAGPWFLSRALYVRAILAVRRGNPDKAIALARESLTRIRELGDKLAFVYTLVPLAAAAALKGDEAWAARILGALDAVTDRTGARFADDSVQDLRDQAERDARARLGPHRWREAYGAGRRSSIDALLNDIDSALSETEYKIR